MLVVGGDGKIGRSIRKNLAALGFQALATTRRRQAAGGEATVFLDLADPATWPSGEGAAVAFLCAGEPSIEACERDPELSRKINVDLTGALAARLAEGGAQVVLISSNRVFDGSVSHISADTAPCPQTEYGRQKADAEKAVLELAGGAVLRVSKILFPDDALIRGWRSELAAGRPIRALRNMVMSPIADDDASAALIEIGLSRLPGIFQLSADRDVSYFDTALDIAASLAADSGLIEGIDYKDLPVPGRAGLAMERLAPQHTTLDVSRLTKEFGIEAPPVFEAVAAVIKN